MPNPSTKGRALITGGAGFIGSHPAEAPPAGGLEALVPDDLSGGRREFIQASIADQKSLYAATESAGAVFHPAALAAAGPGEGPARAWNWFRGTPALQKTEFSQ